MKKMQDAKMEFVSFNADDVLTASGEVPAVYGFAVQKKLTDSEVENDPTLGGSAGAITAIYKSEAYGGLTWNTSGQ